MIGFDIERHRYPKIVVSAETDDGLKQSGTALKLGKDRPKGAGFNVANEAAYSRALKRGFTEWMEYPAQLVVQDVLTLHGSQFKDAALIVASPPCQAYSYRAMPWKRAKALPPPDNTLFEACFRIQREAIAAAGRHIPLIVENVRGAQKWVGRARWNFGSFYLWGDVPALMPPVLRATKWGEGQSPGKLFSDRPPGNVAAHGEDGRKAPGGTRWFNDGPRTHDSLASSASKSPRRKAASALIAKIPLPLSRYIAAVFRGD